MIDASVMPKVPSANTGAATIMIAERGADFILNTNSVQHIPLPDEFNQHKQTVGHTNM